MGEFSKWLLHEDRKELFDYLFAVVLNALFLALTALLLWPLGRASLALQLAKGYWGFWAAVIVTASLLVLAQRIFRMDLYSRSNAYIISALVVSGFVQVGWSAFAALIVYNSATGAPVWMMIILYAVGVVSSYVACVIVGAFYMGGVYKMVNTALALVSFILFSIWPAAGGTIYGWFFDLFWLGPA
jgi:hypothetical protein